MAGTLPHVPLLLLLLDLLMEIYRFRNYLQVWP